MSSKISTKNATLLEQVLKEEGYTLESHSKSYPYTRSFLNREILVALKACKKERL